MTYNRHRVDSNLVNESCSWTSETLLIHSCSNRTASWYPSYTGGSYTGSAGTYKTMEDVVVPGFRGRSRRGEVFFNPLKSFSCTLGVPSCTSNPVFYTGDTTTCSNPAFSHKWQRRVVYSGNAGYQYLRHGVAPFGGQLVDRDDVGRAITEAATKAAAKRGELGGNAYESLAEFGSTLRLPKSLFRSIVGTLQKHRKELDRARQLGDGYLAFRYGIQPLYGEVMQVLDNLEKYVNDKHRISSRGAIGLSASKAFVEEIVPRVGLLATVTHNVTETWTIRAVSLDEVRVTQAMKLGLGLKTLVRTPYELIPYSFVVDWFVNLGDFLAASVPTPGVRNLGSCVTTRRYTTQSSSITGYTCTLSGGSMISGHASGSRTSSYEWKSRSSGLPSPGIVVRSDFRFDDFLRVADSVALIIQKLRFPLRG